MPPVAEGADRALPAVEPEDVKAGEPASLLLPVLPLRDAWLFPESSLSLVVGPPPGLRAVELAARAGGRLLAVTLRDPEGGPRELFPVGTVAELTDHAALPHGGRRVELDGHLRARTLTLIGTDPLVAEVEPLEEGDPGDDWGPAVEALARYLHTHVELRAFLDQQRRSAEPMAWVNLACQYLPITTSARQRLLEASAHERCLKISRGLDALLRKEQGA